MVENVRFVKMKLLRRKLGVTETNIVPNIFVSFAFPKFGFDNNISIYKFVH